MVYVVLDRCQFNKDFLSKKSCTSSAEVLSLSTVLLHAIPNAYTSLASRPPPNHFAHTFGSDSSVDRQPAKSSGGRVNPRP